jgi:RHS repeat-associated protein
VKNALGEPVPPHAGTVEFTYRYDDLHRLTYAHGEAKSRPKTLDTFTSTFQYSDIHNMLSNVQVHHVLHGDGGGGEYPPHTNHDFAYQYNGAGPHQATRIGDTWLTYNENGNTLRECRDPADSTCTQRPSHLRRYLWTEENRLDAVIDGGGLNITKFFYDADGQRIAKLGRGGESITIGQFWAIKGHRAATKHIFAGNARIASKLLPPPGWDDTPPPSIEPVSVTTVLENGCAPSNYQPQKCTILPGGDPVLNDYYAYAKVRPETYYYHADHLGSTSWVTDQSARVHEHVEYFPYGEVWRDPRSDVGASPVKGQRFLFTGKELDEETKLYYFGARYWDPFVARWSSGDPNIRFNEFVPVALNAYQYGRWSPLLFVDPSGRQEEGVTQADMDYYYSQHRLADTVTKETFAKLKPVAEGLVQLHPAIAANVVLSGQQATGGKASTTQRVLAAIGLIPVAAIAKFAKGTLVEHAAEILGRAHIRDDEVIKILAGHFPNVGRQALKSEFFAGTDFLQLIETAVKADTKVMRESGGRLVLEHAFETMIGIDKSGQATNKIRVVLEPNGQIVTAFPFL